MALLPQNPRDQKLFVVAVLAVGLAVVYQQLVWSPKNDGARRRSSSRSTRSIR